MSKAVLFLRTNKRNICLGGLVFEWKRPALEYCTGIRTTIGIIPPHKRVEGLAVRIWGYDKLAQPGLEEQK